MRDIFVILSAFVLGFILANITHVHPKEMKQDQSQHVTVKMGKTTCVSGDAVISVEQP